MTDSARHDAWAAGESYDAYMGRWSRRIAPMFLALLAAPPDLDWLDVGCGTGALSAAILAGCAPRSLVGVDPSPGFLARAAATIDDPRAVFRLGEAGALPVEPASRDLVVSGLVLNFVPDRGAALAEMRRAARPGGRVAFYLWDYPGGGVGFMRAFWQTAVLLDPAAAELGEARRFPFCTPDALTRLAEAAGLADVDCAALETTSVFRDFDDLWRPFTLGAGPAPGYVASLPAAARDALGEALAARLAAAPDGTIRLPLRAWAVLATAP
jgi:SAM-dependent methyltransferase